MMPIRVPFGVIHQPFRSGYRDEGINEFVRCVNSRVPQINKLWIFAEDRITREVHPFSCADVGDFSRDFFQTYYMTEERRRVIVFGRISINVSVK